MYEGARQSFHEGFSLRIESKLAKADYYYILLYLLSLPWYETCLFDGSSALVCVLNERRNYVKKTIRKLFETYYKWMNYSNIDTVACSRYAVYTIQYTHIGHAYMCCVHNTYSVKFNQNVIPHYTKNILLFCYQKLWRNCTADCENCVLKHRKCMIRAFICVWFKWKTNIDIRNYIYLFMCASVHDTVAYLLKAKLNDDKIAK